jgi:hypothetical protein
VERACRAVAGLTNQLGGVVVFGIHPVSERTLGTHAREASRASAPCLARTELAGREASGQRRSTTFGRQDRRRPSASVSGHTLALPCHRPPLRGAGAVPFSSTLGTRAGGAAHKQQRWPSRATPLRRSSRTPPCLAIAWKLRINRTRSMTERTIPPFHQACSARVTRSSPTTFPILSGRRWVLQPKNENDRNEFGSFSST